MDRPSRFAIVAGALCCALACAVNPVTGVREFVLMSESQEIAMGQQSAPQIAASMGLYGDDDLQRYVEGVGMPMAQASERPHLPWQFQVVDDPLVNAFAVPGGFLYVTRGILAHMNSEAELAAVLGHEIGHVTARHSVSQYTKTMGAQLVLIPTMVLLPEMQQAGQLLGQGLQVLLLKYGRDDEKQSDRLGLAYMSRAGYQPHEMVNVFRTLGRVGAKSGAGGLPEWLSSHPNPANREQLISEQIAQLPGGAAGKVGRETFLKRIDGVVYGADPRQGYFGDDGVFHHPELAFRLRFPRDWQLVNRRQVVGALAPEKDAMVQLTLAAESDADTAVRTFLAAEGMQSTAPRSQRIGGLTASSADFAVAGEQGAVQGIVAAVEHGGHVFRLLGYAPQDRFASHERALRDTVESFARETSSAVLNVKPWRIALVKPTRRLSIDAFARAYPGPASAEDLALINQIPEGGSYAPGVVVKRVVGKPLP